MDFEPMSPDDMQRTMQFLLGQQAQFAADMEKLTVKTDRLADGLIGLTGLVGRLAEAQARTDEQLRQTDARVEDVAVQVKATDAQLGLLIELFERHIRDDHGPRRS